MSTQKKRHGKKNIPIQRSRTPLNPLSRGDLMNSPLERGFRGVFFVLLLLSLLYFPSPVLADNCSGLSDCFSGNMMSALWLLLGLILLVSMSWYLWPLLLGFTIAPALQSVIAPAGKSSIGLKLGHFLHKFLSRSKRAPTPCIPNIELKREKELEINYKKLGPYIKHTPQYLERLKAGDSAPYFEDPTSIAELIQEAWQKGKPAADKQTRHHDFERPIGYDAKDNPLTRLTVHQEPEGKFYGYPS